MVRTKRPGVTGASSSAPVSNIVQEQESSGSEEPVAGQSGRGSRKRLRRTGKQVQADKRVEWKEGMMNRRFKNERQVKAKSIGNDHLVIQRIRSKGMNFWIRRLEGYNIVCVIEFYQNMRTPPTGFETSNTARIVSRVGGKDIMIDPFVIAKYLGYERPAPETVNYPRDEEIDDGLINNVLYTNPKNAKIPHVVGEFRDDIRVLNKAFHHNLYPRGLEHKPSRKSGELIMISTARMPFPCMITTICKQQGVKGNDYKKMERLDPGPITGAFLKKSKPRSGILKGSSKAFLTTKPGPKEKKDSMWNKLFCQNVAILKCLWKSEEKRKKEKMERKKLSKEVMVHANTSSSSDRGCCNSSRRNMLSMQRILLALLLLSSIAPKSDGQFEDWCVADEQTPAEELQRALDWACGNGADCSKLQVNQPCYLPNTVKDHASFAFNSYYQKLKHKGATCYFNAAALITALDPSHGSCKYEVIS
ncbi:hypothetical protein RHSIM_Rhsim02G0091300 [Rhododendron simsii]|uniref:X8 domain-containing protein n=1 Tax=Rhododendron simsii TaxID=118357 RepID=A0A834HLY4_RHOSS|nr:hypothetical protein RHSIM_Rhsim02G0091300 [Rhododendron simsii]